MRCSRGCGREGVDCIETPDVLGEAWVRLKLAKHSSAQQGTLVVMVMMVMMMAFGRLKHVMVRKFEAGDRAV